MTRLGRHWSLFLALSAAFLVVLPLSVAELGRDQANWLTVAMALGEGSVMYRDIAVVNTPGLGGMFWALNGIFGEPTLTPWILHAASTLLVIVAAYLWALQSFGRAEATGAAVLCTLLWPQNMDWWEIAQKDQVAFAFAFLSMAFLAVKSNRPGWAVAAGACMATAVLTKTAAVVYALPLAVQLAVSRPSPRGFLAGSLWTIAGGLLALMPAAFYVLSHNSWAATYASVVERAVAYGGANREGGGMLARQIAGFVLVAPSFALLLLFIPRVSWAEKPVRWLPLLALLLATILGYFAQGRGWMYHAVPFIGALSIGLGVQLGAVLAERRKLWSLLALLLVALGLCQSWEDRHERWVAYATHMLGSQPRQDLDPLFAVPYFTAPSESREMAAWIEEVTGPEDRIFVWGMESQLYVYSGRMFVGPSFADAPIWHPQLAEIQPEYFNAKRKRFFDDLTRTPPAVFVVVQQDASPVEPWPSDRALQTLPEVVEFLEKNYEIGKTTERFVAYKRL